MLSDILLGNCGSANGSLALAATGTQLAFGFVAPASKTVSKVSVFCSTVTAPGAVACEIWSNVNSGANVGKPNVALSGTVSLTPAVGWCEWTGVGQALIAGSRYHVVLKGPSSGSATFLWQSGTTGPGLFLQGDHANKWNTSKWHSTDGGTTWVTGGSTVFGFMLEFSDGTVWGLPYPNAQYQAAVTGTDEAGCEFVLPGNVVYNITGGVMHVNVTGTVTGDLSYRLYRNRVLVAETLSVPVGIAASFGKIPLAFSSTLQLPGGTYQLMSHSSANETGGAGYRCLVYTSARNTAAAKTLRQFREQYVVKSGAVWTPTDTIIPTFGLILSGTQPFAPAGINRRQFNSQR